MTPEQLQDIRDRAAAATPGPWSVSHDEAGFEDIRTDTGYTLMGVGAIADARFAAHARTDIPALLAEVDRLRALLDSQTDDGH